MEVKAAWHSVQRVTKPDSCRLSWRSPIRQHHHGTQEGAANDERRVSRGSHSSDSGGNRAIQWHRAIVTTAPKHTPSALCCFGFRAPPSPVTASHSRARRSVLFTHVPLTAISYPIKKCHAVPWLRCS